VAAVEALLSACQGTFGHPVSPLLCDEGDGSLLSSRISLRVRLLAV
jgi:hypothetical protein